MINPWEEYLKDYLDKSGNNPDRAKSFEEIFGEEKDVHPCNFYQGENHD